MHEFEDEVRKISEWAERHPLVKKAYFFGSRFKGNYRDDSDMDIAVEIRTPEEDSSLISAWIFECDEMRSQLQKLVKFKVDLQWHENEDLTPDMHKYLKEGSVVIYP